MEADFDKILFTRQQIALRVRQMAKEIANLCQKQAIEELTLVAILSGSVIFLADLIRNLPIRMKIGLITVSSYPGPKTKAEQIRIMQDLNIDVAGQHIVIIDDILDTGNTLRSVRDLLSEQRPKTIRTCVLLRKPTKAPPDLTADFVGFDIDDYFVVGYGLDYNNNYRNCADIGVLKKELYTS
ncbi:MAG: hypoxanthine phosphoribosyltransferase [Planctomycetota bacterium]|jgi:hypoxanthine phosphoribosyltransferase